MGERCDAEACAEFAAVGITVPAVSATEVYLCQRHYSEARPAMEMARDRWRELVRQGCDVRIATRRVRVEAERRGKAGT